MTPLPGEDPDVTFEIPSGEVHLTRRKKHERYTQIRRTGSFGWTLGPDNLLTQLIDEHLRTDLAGSVAAQLIGRASLTWEMAADIKVLHEPDDVESLQPTPDLEQAAEEMAHAFRAEIDPEVIMDEAQERLDGPFLTRSAYAVHLGRETKDVPNHPKRCFGRLSPLGRSNLQVVIPWLGYVPARALTDWTSFRFMGWPPSESRQSDIRHPHVDLWLQPEYRARDELTGVLAVTYDMRASTEAPDSARTVELDCEDLLVCPPLRTVFAPGLKLRLPDEENRPVDRPLPVDDPELLEETLANVGHPEVADPVNSGWWTLVPLSPSRFVRDLPDSERLLHALLWMTHEESDFPLDPWDYTDLEDRGLPSRRDDIIYYEFDREGFAGAVAEVIADALPGTVAEDAAERAVGRCRRAARMLARELQPMLEERAGPDGELADLREAVSELRGRLEEVGPSDFRTANGEAVDPHAD